MKYTDTQITFSEFPDEIALCINITNCSFHCPGCHSPELWEDIGTELTFDELNKLIQSNKGITCVGFMGGYVLGLSPLLKYCNQLYPKLKLGWYTGMKRPPVLGFNLDLLDYIKLGPYIKELGGLDNPNTNQRFYKIENGQLIDWTYKFWKHGNK